MTIWLSDNPWVYAVLLLVVGPVIALFGKKWFPYVAGITSGLFVGDAVAHFAAHSKGAHFARVSIHKAKTDCQHMKARVREAGSCFLKLRFIIY